MKPAQAKIDIRYPTIESLPIDEKVATKVIMFTAKNNKMVFIGYDFNYKYTKTIPFNTYSCFISRFFFLYNDIFIQCFKRSFIS